MSVIYGKKSNQVGGQVIYLFVERVVILFREFLQMADSERNFVG